MDTMKNVLSAISLRIVVHFWFINKLVCLSVCVSCLILYKVNIPLENHTCIKPCLKMAFFYFSLENSRVPLLVFYLDWFYYSLEFLRILEFPWILKRILEVSWFYFSLRHIQETLWALVNLPIRHRAGGIVWPWI